jgi:hypothetical protein
MSAFDAKSTGLGLATTSLSSSVAAQSGRITPARVHRNEGYPTARCCVRLRSARCPLSALSGHGLLHRSCLLVTQNGYRLPQETTFWMREFDLCRSRPSIPSGLHRTYGSGPPSIPPGGGPLRSVHRRELVSDSRHRNEFELYGFPCRLPLTPRSPSSAASSEAGLPRFTWFFLRPRRPSFNSSAERAWFHFSLTQADAGGPSNIAL